MLNQRVIENCYIFHIHNLPFSEFLMMNVFSYWYMASLANFVLFLHAVISSKSVYICEMYRPDGIFSIIHRIVQIEQFVL